MIRTTRRVVLFALAAVGIAAGAATAGAETIRMGFTGSPTTLSLPFFVAQKKGYLGDLAVEEVYVTGDSNAMRVLLSGNVDIATIGVVNVLTSIQAGAKVKAIGSWQPIADYNLVMAKGKGTTLKDLEGKTIATSGPGGMPDQLPRLIMRSHGVDESKSRFLQVGGHAARLQAVLGGRADASVINTVTSATTSDVVVITKVASELPKLGYVWNVVREESLTDPKFVKAYETITVAGIRGARYIMAHPEEAAEILHERVPDLPLDLCRTAVADLNGDNLWGVDGGLDPAIATFTSKLNTELGILKADVPADAVLDRRFVEAALKALNKESGQ